MWKGTQIWKGTNEAQTGRAPWQELHLQRVRKNICDKRQRENSQEVNPSDDKVSLPGVQQRFGQCFKPLCPQKEQAHSLKFESVRLLVFLAELNR